MQVTIFTANCVGQAGNCSYPNKVTAVTPEQLQEAVKKDHVCAEFKGNYRSIHRMRLLTYFRILGNYAGKLSAEALTMNCKRNVKPEMAELKGKRLIISSEMGEGMRLNAER